MKQSFELDHQEKKLEWLILFTAILVFLTVIVGVYFQSHGINHDNILIPLFFFLVTCFFLFYSINAFTKGHLVRKWTPWYVFSILLFLKKKLSSSPTHTAEKFVIKLLGTCGLIISAALFGLTILIIVRGV